MLDLGMDLEEEPLAASANPLVVGTPQKPRVRHDHTPPATPFHERKLSAEASRPSPVAKVTPSPARRARPKKGYTFTKRDVEKLSIPLDGPHFECRLVDLGVRIHPHDVEQDKHRFSRSEKECTPIDPGNVKPSDIYLGREYRGSDHKGNEAYRRITGNPTIKAIYKSYGREHGMKTKMSTFLLERVIEGRFIATDPNGGLYLATKDEARNKIRQALCEK